MVIKFIPGEIMRENNEKKYSPRDVNFFCTHFWDFDSQKCVRKLPRLPWVLSGSFPNPKYRFNAPHRFLSGSKMHLFWGIKIPKMYAKKFDVSGGVFFFVVFPHYFTGDKLNTQGRRDNLCTFFVENCPKNVRKKIRRLAGSIFFRCVSSVFHR